MRQTVIDNEKHEKIQGTPSAYMACGDIGVAATHICVTSQNGLNDN